MFVLLAVSCSKPRWTEITLVQLDESSFELGELSDKKVVFVFLSPECPLCQSYALRINELAGEWTSDSLLFVGVVAGNYYPVSEIRQYIRKYELELPVMLDPEMSLVRALNASITPEVFLCGPDGNILYQGAIDDWAISLGQKKLQVEQEYLHDAISSMHRGESIEPDKTQAVGCFIE